MTNELDGDIDGTEDNSEQVLKYKNYILVDGWVVIFVETFRDLSDR